MLVSFSSCSVSTISPQNGKSTYLFPQFQTDFYSTIAHRQTVLVFTDISLLLHLTVVLLPAGHVMSQRHVSSTLQQMLLVYGQLLSVALPFQFNILSLDVMQHVIHVSRGENNIGRLWDTFRTYGSSACM